jgi:uncharacterized lipoprotein YddW (UPF0748 family)
MRSFLHRICSFFPAFLATAALAAPGTAQASEVRACWLTQYAYLTQSEAGLRGFAQNMRQGGINTVYVAMYAGGGVTYWPSKAFKAAGGSWGSPSFDWAHHLIRIFHEEGLQVGAWVEYGLALGSSTHPVAVAHPDWLARDSTGGAVTGENGGFVFLSPGHPQVVQLMKDMSKELAENYDFDDIQLDRFRWGRKSTGREYGYETVTANAYQAQYGTTPPTNVNNSTWVTFRESLVNNAVQQCYGVIKAANPKICVSSAPLGSYGLTQMMQRWPAWVAGGYLDLVMPQMYMTTLSAFQTEFNTQKAQAGANLSKLAVGFRAQDAADWTVVRDQMNYARSQGVAHGTLWVYHFYTSVPAIQDELDNLPDPGQPWAAPAINPFVSPDMVQVIVDNSMPSTTAAAYVEAGSGWSTSAQADFHGYNSRIVLGGSAASAEFHARIDRAGAYDVYEWHTASSNRNDAAQFTIHHAGGANTVSVDQRSNGGRWNLVGRWLFENGARTRVVSISNTGSLANEYTVADAVKLVYRDEALAYCAPKTNSLGCVPAIGVSGTPTITGLDNLVVTATNVLNQKSGIFFWGLAPKSSAFGGGTMCVQSPVKRSPPLDSGGATGQNCSGVYSFPLTHAYLSANALTPGTAVFGQFWSRDPLHPDNSTIGLTGGISFVVRP